MNEGNFQQISVKYSTPKRFSSFRRRFVALGAVVAALGLGAICRADFSFSATSGGVLSTGSATTNLILTGQPTSQVLNFSQQINIQDVEISTAAPPQNLINAIVPFSFTLTLVQSPGFQASTTGTGSVTASGSLLITRADLGGELSSLVSLTVPTFIIGNTQYTFSNPNYAAPVVNSAPNSVGAGNLSIQINPTIVPEPATIGLLGLLGLGLGRKRKSM